MIFCQNFVLVIFYSNAAFLFYCNTTLILYLSILPDEKMHLWALQALKSRIFHMPVKLTCSVRVSTAHSKLLQ